MVACWENIGCLITYCLTKRTGPGTAPAGNLVLWPGRSARIFPPPSRAWPIVPRPRPPAKRWNGSSLLPASGSRSKRCKNGRPGAEVFNLVLANEQEARAGGGQSLLHAATITFPHGSRVIAVPGKPETVRGYSANALFTEFAFFESPGGTWRALAASVANSLRGEVKKLRIITTPNGIPNRLRTRSRLVWAWRLSG